MLQQIIKPINNQKNMNTENHTKAQMRKEF